MAKQNQGIFCNRQIQQLIRRAAKPYTNICHSIPPLPSTQKHKTCTVDRPPSVTAAAWCTLGSVWLPTVWIPPSSPACHRLSAQSEAQDTRGWVKHVAHTHIHTHTQAEGRHQQVSMLNVAAYIHTYTQNSKRYTVPRLHGGFERRHAV